MALSPIEKIDKACGSTPSEYVLASDDKIVRAMAVVCAAAKAFWEGERPVRWDVEQHLAEPAVNCTTQPQRKLAVAVAALVKIGW